MASKLPIHASTNEVPIIARRRARNKQWAILTAAVFSSLALFHSCSMHSHVVSSVSEAGVCEQSAPLQPFRNRLIFDKLGEIYESDQFSKKAIEVLSGAVQVPTVTYDNMGPIGEDKRWENRADFSAYLLKSFPLVHTTLELTKVNTHGLLYVWPGSESSLKPILLMAHQDVVPVPTETEDKWAYPPFSGHYDGQRIWGRGASDDKSSLIGILATVESLLAASFEPTRTVVLSFGFDEEAGGRQGARHLSAALLDRFGEDSFSLIIDEGSGYDEQYGATFATVGVGEKGALNTIIEIHTPGGHSSVPPPHSSIGMLASMIVEYENNPIKPELHRGTPVYETIRCLGAHAPDMSKGLRHAIQRSDKSDSALHKVEDTILGDLLLRSLVGTTQAVDMIDGGVKSNALPERAGAVVNHRIATDSSVSAVQERDTALLKDLATKYNLTYTAFGQSADPPSTQGYPAYGSLTLTSQYGLEPAPVTPIDAKPYQLLSGTIKAAYAAHRGVEVDNSSVFVAPGIMSGNTDTKFYWKLSKHIFRYGHQRNFPGNIHTVNESILVDNYLEQIRFFTTLLLNADESDI